MKSFGKFWIVLKSFGKFWKVLKVKKARLHRQTHGQALIIYTMPACRGRPPKSKKNSPIIDGAKFIKRFQPKLIYDQRGLLYQDLPIGCVRTLKGGRLYQEILREKNSQYYWGAEIIKVFFRGRTRRESMVLLT